MLSQEIFIGIDSGVGGAIAFIHACGAIAVYDCPLLPKEGKWNRHDSKAMFELLRLECNSRSAIAASEAVRFDSRDDRKKGSAEVLVRSHEAWLTCLSILEIPTYRLEVPVWRRIAGSQHLGADKEAIVTHACQLFPEHRKKLKGRSPRAKSGYRYEHGRAEALLLAHVARVLSSENLKEVV